MRIAAEQRFWSRVTIPSDPAGCWLWDHVNNYGYGHLNTGTRRVHAHRYAYELLVGPIPDGLVIDHLCRDKACVNPLHLEAITQLENVRRGAAYWAAREMPHCVKGHPRTPENTYVRPNGTQCCRVCKKAWNLEYKARRKEREGTTERERMVLRLLQTEDGRAEGYMFDDLYYENPRITHHGLRIVGRNLQRKGLVTFGEWLDEHAGCVLHITDKGRTIEC